MKKPTLSALLVITCLRGAGCGPDTVQETSLRVYLDTEGVGSDCPSDSCTDFGMSCGATMLLQLTDGATGDVVHRSTGEPLRFCVSLGSAEDLCTMQSFNPELTFFGVPPRSMRAEIALWSPDKVAAGTCPEPGRFDLFDAQGRPQPNFAPQPAFAGAQYFRAGTNEVISVPLSCPNPADLSIDTCAANLPTDVTATLFDMDALLEVDHDQARTMTVAVGEPRQRSDGNGGTETVLETSELFPLSFVDDQESPSFAGMVEKRFGSVVCVSVLEDTPQATSVLHCQNAPAQTTILELRGQFLPKETLDAIAALIGPDAARDGLVIGRVVDTSLAAASDVTVTSDSGSVLYVSDDLSMLTGTSTSSSGYFVSIDTSFPGSFTAGHPDGRREVGSPRGGTVRNRITAVLVQLSDEVIQP